MANYTTAVRRSDLVERVLATVAQFFEAAAERRARRRIYTTTLAELNALSARDLADLGMHRSELKRVATQAAQGPLAD